MNVLLINGSTRKNGCTCLALTEAAKAIREAGRCFFNVTPQGISCRSIPFAG